ncbi:hypothetical protein P2H44_22775 [Albimonas sp. CAU 1670]|uniref:hypothetical protein n=1 Tax=Albimonas sp. CAU 1670 TaxID=3032599 RepID=UPI0023DB69F4|nr:hypothetical protein [Albimonas sp. CAU 1670]MDF2235390.1 hypothetical protein [Albimonas sp. CAU 1670]
MTGQLELTAIEGGAGKGDRVPPMNAADKALVAVLTAAMVCRRPHPSHLRLAMADVADLMPRLTPLHPTTLALAGAARELLELGEVARIGDEETTASPHFWRAWYALEDALALMWARRAGKAVELADVGADARRAGR